VDESVKALRFAAIRAERRALTNVTFIHDDLHTVRIEDEFDAVVGRLILLYTPDPAQILRKFAALVRPGGVVAMMEYEMTSSGALPQTDLSLRAIAWICEAFHRSGLDPMLGGRLGTVLRAAGLAPTVFGLQGYLEPGDPAGPRLAAETVRTLLPVIEKTGIASADEVGVDTLAERLAQEGRRLGTMFKPPTLVGAWARVAGAA
jgi:hypothetical protein